MSCFLQFTDLRKKQLDIEKEIDKELPQKCEQCPILLLKYLMHRRQVNRNQFQKVQDANILKTYGTISDNMDEITSHQNEILYALTNNIDMCEYLDTFLKN